MSNESYPELRGMTRRWDRHCAWWRALPSAFRDVRLYAFFAVVLGAMAGIVGGGHLVADRFSDGLMLAAMDSAALVVATTIGGALTVTRGGDLMRPHLRRGTEHARESCPGCGHLLTAHRVSASATGASHVRCPECGGSVAMSHFVAPFAIEKEFRSSWRGSGWDEA